MIPSAPQVFVREYRGNQNDAFAEFQYDAAELAEDGWVPSFQQWVPGASPGLIAGLAWLTWIKFKRPGALFVTYQGSAHAERPADRFEDWVYRLGVYEARRVLDHEVRDHVISRSEYADRVAEIDELGLD